MKFKLINEPNEEYTTIEQILVNRGIPRSEIYKYTHLDDSVINPPTALGEELLHEAAKVLFWAIQEQKKAFVVVDCDCDGYTSSALLINYLYKIVPS